MPKAYRVLDLPVNGVPKGGTVLLEPYQAEFLVQAEQLAEIQAPEPAPINLTVKAKAEKPKPVRSKAPSLPKPPKPKPVEDSSL